MIATFFLKICDEDGRVERFVLRQSFRLHVDLLGVCFDGVYFDVGD